MLIKDTKEILKIAKEVTEKTIYQPGYPRFDECKEIRLKGDTPKPGISPGVTWCNEGANEILTTLGYDTWWLLDTQYHHIGYTTANEMYYNAVSAAEKGRIQIVNAKEAQELANDGVVSIVLAPGKAHGHAAVVIPCSHEFNPDHGCFIAQAGGKNGFFYVKEIFITPYVFPGQLKYFLLEEKKKSFT
jgi:hypothetical protein